ncbi:C2 domain containing protein [Cordyceps fumosorosea ARSEF 2679]|uniref:C2 domain containing protein n=1 Tax=Cordyceps fumosorosea (strain ARSEF 2679) TaxID=1081104 RepID=A0A168EMC4_CORFA|nr:C2 domain containing protein [Cordyceps fumosorosea ARSEF 2679]OAA73985.1 C2 domain containing protein [Cordyceps fumosorosea ARSEF 2679]
MSQDFRRSSVGRRLKSSSKDSGRRAHPKSKSNITLVEHDEARSFALRTAYLHYLLQPKAKRKQYVAAPKPPARTHTSVGQLVQEYVSGSASALKLPSSFPVALLDRVGGVLKGSERLPGFNDAAVKRSFAEAYIAFSEKTFCKTIEKERKFEPLVLMFYSSATKAAQKGRAPDDDSWKLLPDRHLALFVRLAATMLRDQGHERDKSELFSRLITLENKLLTNDQDLVSSGSDSAGTTIEVVVPLSYDVKDMPMVQIVAGIFGLSLSDVQAEVNEKHTVWTEEAALRDLKTYQQRLTSNGSGALRSDDFDVEESFTEWQKSEAHFLSQMMLEILTAKPELTKSSSSGDKLLPSRPQSMYVEDQAYADLSRAISSLDTSLGFDPLASISSISNDASSIRTVEEGGLYTFIPPNPRAYYKYILQHAVAFDQLHADPALDYQPLSKQSMDLMTELCVRWRLPQASRLITLLEIAARKFLDQEIVPEELDTIIEVVKNPQPEPKKPPYIQNYALPLTDIPPSKWTIHDFAVYQSTFHSIHDAILRELYDIMAQCYDSKPPNIGAVMFILENHIYKDEIFTPRPEAVAEFTEYLTTALRNKAVEVYRENMRKEIPVVKEDWEFAHVVKLGKTITKLCDRIRKRYKNNQTIIGVDPFAILVEEIFPNFESDAGAILETILGQAQVSGEDIDIEDGFELYKELVAIRRIHHDYLPTKAFAFNIENLLVDFVWRWIRVAEGKMSDYVDQAIKQDQFQVRTAHVDHIVRDSERHSVSVIDLFMLFNQTVDQVFKLEWDNDEHHARFMTALARSFSAGLGRYCEVIEQRFTKEMDRPSAEEIALQNKSTQEKWMQFAKDAWNNKEKAEPFQFFAESFVKLNNIEYAMQELDKLEKSMNSDACAELLEKIDGPRKQTRKPSKYTFTIKVVEAEDLKACDPNGYSDPYVVFGDEYQKRLYKTRIIYRNLNPRWDESFEFTVQGPVNLIATVWDYDSFGDHDYVGRTSLKIDPAHFGDYLPREFWLDLDSQGRMLIRVSMEGERDDIQFHFGKAFRHLKRAERDMVRKITDKVGLIKCVAVENRLTREKLTSQINSTLSVETLRGLLGLNGLGSQVTNLWKKRTSTLPVLTPQQIVHALTPLFTYFDENFAIMKQTLTDATMIAVMTRLWKEVLMTIENLLVPPVSDKPSTQKSLSRKELDIVYHWLELLFGFFNAKEEHSGEQLGVPAEVLKSPKWHELASLNFFYFEDTHSLIRESERMASATAQRAQQALLSNQQTMRHSAPPGFGAALGGAGAFASMGTIRRGKSIMMSRNLGTMRKAKEAKRRETQADPSDDMILRILRMRPEAAHYLKERHRQKERQAATAAAALIVKNSITQGWGANVAANAFGRVNLPRR